MADLVKQGIDAVAKSLVEFGYPDASPELVQAAYDNWKAGRDVGCDIIAMMAVGQFEEYPEIFGKPSS